MSIRNILARQRAQQRKAQTLAHAKEITRISHEQATRTASFRSLSIDSNNDDFSVGGTIPGMNNASLAKVANFGQVMAGQSGILLTPEGDFNRGSSVLTISPWLSSAEDD